LPHESSSFSSNYAVIIAWSKVTFSAADGLGGNAFNPGAAWQAPDGAPDAGRMYFGGAHGLTAFYPDQITLSDYQPPVVLTELRLANEPVSPGADALLQRPIWAAEQLTLRHDDDLVSFAFAALDYASAAWATKSPKQRYRYRLEGLETAWVDVDGQHRFATYTHLPAGEYVFRVQGTNASGVWSTHQAALALTVLPAWWETWWFRGGLFLLITALVGGVIHWRIHDIRRRNTELESQVAARTQELSEEKAHVETAHAVLRTVLDNLDAVIYVADMDSHEILFANAQVRAIFGNVQGRICWQVLQEGRDSPCAFCTNARLLDAAGRPTGIYRWQYQNTRTERWYTVADSAVEWIDGRLVRLSMAADITEYREAERRLVSQQRLLAALDERERIGRELHDDLGQVMGYVNVQAQTVQDLLAQDQEAQAHAALHQLIQVAQEAHDDVRKYILGIRTAMEPAPLDFLTALEHYLRELEQRYGLTVHVNWPEALRESPLAPAVETQLLRIIQEALTNVCKHADSASARLIFTLHPEEVQVIISDEGCGFDASNRQSPSSNPHFGLTIMRERAEGVGGSLDIQSRPGGGTQVVVRLPRVLAPSADTTMRGLRVLLADDHDLYVQGLRNLLTARGVQVVGVAHDGMEALALARELLPDLILMDVHMPHCDGLEATRQIKDLLPEVKIVMLTVAADDTTLFRALQSGAAGYLLKNLESRHFFDLLREIMRGEEIVSPTVAARALAEMAQEQAGGAASSPSEEAPVPLTPRQREVLALLTEGMTYLEIAQKLHISRNTVKYHVTRMLERLDLQSRYELASYAREHDIVDSTT
jgi:PAS domain S-box-containing protein